MKRALPAEDLSVLGRRGELSVNEQRRLDVLRAASPVERWLDDAGAAFDGVDVDSQGDRALLDRAVDRALTPRTVARRSKRVLSIALVAAACSATLAAAAVTIPRWIGAAAPPMPSQCARCPAAAPSVPAPTATSNDAPASVPSSQAVEAGPAPSAAASVVAPPASAAEQFARANGVRKAGQTALAVAAYRQLQRSHPDSPEAQLSYVLLGRILLQQGSAEGAREQFARYLRASPNGSLAEDALYGEATALRVSGRTGEERRVHEQLVARFPNSIHARASRARLRELD